MDKTAVMLMLTGCLWASSAMAATDQNAHLQQVLRQLATEKQQLTTQIEQLQKENTEFKARNGKLEAKTKSLEQRADKTIQANEAATERIYEFNDKLKESLGKLRETLMELRKAEATLGEQSDQLTACMRVNVQLYDAGKDMLTKYEEKGVWDALAQAEPITGLKQVEIENVIEDYRYKIEGLTVSKQVEQQVREQNQAATSAVRQAQSSGQQTLDAVAPLVEDAPAGTAGTGVVAQ